MKRIVAAVALCTGWYAGPAAAADKPLVVALWPGKAPDEAGDIGPESPKYKNRR